MPQNFRLYAGAQETSTVIGATEGVRLTLGGPTFDRILEAVSDEDKPYQVVAEGQDARPPKTISPYHVEIEPPLAPEDVETFGRLLTQEAFRDRGEVAVIDHRDGLPERIQDAYMINRDEVVAIAA